jgi:hypothetical protein
MQRLLISLSSIVALTATVHAQTAPDAQPTNQPPDQAGSPPATADAPPPVEAPPPPPPPLASDPKKLGVGKESPGSWFTPGLNLQLQFVMDVQKKVGTDGTADQTNTTLSTFKIRRLEISGGGEIIPKTVKYRFMIDPSRVRDTFATTNAANPTAGGANIPVRTFATPISAVQDGYVTFGGEFADVVVGQFKTPIGWEGYQAASKIIMAERSFLDNTEGGQRDMGVRVEKTFKMFSYVVGVVNGAGQNNFDTNNAKDGFARLEIFPIPGLTIGGATLDTIGYRTKAGTKDRWEGDLIYDNGPFHLQGEFIHNRDVIADNGAYLNSQGGYVAIAYKSPRLGSGPYSGELQPVIRVGYFDPNSDINVQPARTGVTATPAAQVFPGTTDERYDYEFGLNYYLRGHETKIQLSFDRQQFDDSTAKQAINELIAMTQIWF